MMDVKRAIAVLDEMEARFVKCGARKDVEREAIQVAKAALKAQGEAEVWEIERKPIAVPDCDEASQIRLKIGNQSFNINDYCENHEQAEFMAQMLDHALRKIAAPQPAQAPDGWQPIETAPMDGTRLLLLRASDEMQFTGSWCDCYGWSDLNAPIAGVTHWMPLPAAPAPGGDE